ncbi:TPA: isoprenylcysteine carboxylmethyltransferase family protein [Pasteurella multocida]|nr:isoprenylcysteine carboxylmethyltransferase family protein [Pasteurella multocida]HDR0968850.1 isoprenylcysteine carboxylmethyltransferase family protein [Pasteurella multocida]HDR0993522.1 isoprenylcysteine carboxylmethyltransferase family protein [Pasteurella multocida]
MNNVKLPPPVVFLCCAVAMAYVPALITFPQLLWLIISLVLVSVLIAGMSLWQFLQARTTVSPLALEQTSTLVVTGIYQISRNPMYLSLALLLLAWALWLGSLSAVIFFIIFVVVMTKWQIKQEEQVLEHLFGQAYLDYKQKVRRWL